MRVFLVGADLEENLGLGMIAAVAREAGHRVEVAPFNERSQIDGLAAALADSGADVIGLSIQFQHRAQEFVALARKLRQQGFAGHLTCGGQLPSMAYEQLLRDETGIDSVVLHEGEGTFAALLAALERGESLEGIAGLARLGSAGEVVLEKSGPLVADLDRLPFPARYRAHSTHLGIPFVPVVGGRGCWGRCSFCSITSYYRQAQAQGGGRRLRLRSSDDLAEEMATLWHAAGGAAIFCFHDETLLLPREADTLARLEQLSAALAARGVDRLALVGKCRPDSLTPQLARRLGELGVVRLYVGVENVSAAGSAHLARQLELPRVTEALDACRTAGIVACYNLLIFEPETGLADVAENIAFMQRHADFPVNFCRAEPYVGTPLAEQLAAEGRLRGSYLGYDYRLRDDRAELLFRISAAAFRERNFGADGVHNRYMGLGYRVALLQHFYGASVEWAVQMALAREATRLTRQIVEESADFLQEALNFAAEVPLDEHDRIGRFTADLGLRIAAADRIHHAALDRFFRELEAARPNPDAATPSRGVLLAARGIASKLAKGVALSSALAGWTLSACTNTTVMDPVPADRGASETGADGGRDGMLLDPLPADAGVDRMVVDPLPADAGVDRMGGDPLPADQGVDIMVVDPAPQPDIGAAPDRAVMDPLPRDMGPVGMWRETLPQRVERSRDLPLYSPPRPELELLAREGDGSLRVAVRGLSEAATLRWESDGEVVGQGAEVHWFPESTADLLRLGVRTTGGVAVVCLRAGSRAAGA